MISEADYVKGGLLDNSVSEPSPTTIIPHLRVFHIHYPSPQNHLEFKSSSLP